MFPPSRTNPAINMFRGQLYLMITGMSLCSSTLFAALRLLFFPSCIIHSQVSPMSDLHMDMGRAPWTAEGKPSGIMAVMMKRAMKKKIHQYIPELSPIFYKLQTTFRLQKLIRYQVIFFFLNHVVLWEFLQKIVRLTQWKGLEKRAYLEFHVFWVE